MRLLVTSDSHGRAGNIFDICEMHINDTDIFVSLGDSNGGADYENAKLYFGSKLRLFEVSGNCDFYSSAPTLKFFTFAGKNIMACHGHTLKVKFGMETIVNEAKRRNMDLVLFGHTHKPFSENIDGIHFFNPGAVLDGRYGMIDFTENGTMYIHAKLQ